MAITRLTGLHTLFTATQAANISSDPDEFAMVRLDDGRIVVLGETFPSGSFNLSSQFYSIVNAQNTSSTAVTTFATNTATVSHEFPNVVAGSGNTFAIAWDRYTGDSPFGADALIKFQSATGAAVAGPVSGSTAAGGAEFSSTAVRLGNGNYLMTWSNSLASTQAALDTDVMGRIFTPAGVAVGGEFRINAATAGGQLGTAGTSLGDGRSFVFWGDGTFTTDVNGPLFIPAGMNGRFIDKNGLPVGAEIAIDTVGTTGIDYDDAKIVALGNGGFAIGRSEEWDPDKGTAPPPGFQNSFRAQAFNAAGVKVGAEIVIDSTTTFNTSGLKLVELANGGFAALWQVLNGGATESHVRQFTMSGVEIGTEIILGNVANSGVDGLDEIYDLELTFNGRLMGFGYDEGTAGRAGTQIFDFGDERLIGNLGNNTLYGKNGVHDVILGLDGIDNLNGLGFNDIIDGGNGNDILTGGSGADIFQFTTAANALINKDIITDFSAPLDTIQLENAIFRAFGALPTGTTLPADAFWASANGQAHDADDRILYNTTTGQIIYDSNGNGAGGFVQFAVLQNKAVITAADFVII